MVSPTLVWLILIPLIAWRLYARFRRLVGRQRMSVVRTWFRIVLFALLVLLLAWLNLVRPTHVGGLLAGCAIGAGLGIYGIRKTRFEVSAGGLFYTPHAPLGIGLTVLFVGRILYRLISLPSFDPAALSGPQGFTNSVTTLAIFGLLAGYYVSYGVSLVRWHAEATRAPAVQPAPVELVAASDSPRDAT